MIVGFIFEHYIYRTSPSTMGIIFIHTLNTTSTVLTYESPLLPLEYLDYADVFSKKPSDTLLEHQS